MSFYDNGVSKFNRSSRILSEGPEVLANDLEEPNSPMINTELSVHQRAAELANMDFGNNSPTSSEEDIPEETAHYNPFYSSYKATESTNLLPPDPPDLESFHALLGNQVSTDEYVEFNHTLGPDSSPSKTSSILNFGRKLNRSVSNKLLNIQPSHDNHSVISQQSSLNFRSAFFGPLVDLCYESSALLPCVFLGLLLNVLDALSYGMIVFPINKPVFAELGPAGLSMFYMSCIVSQLVYSLGGSAFHSAIGSEMIEVTPFFHVMAANITARIGADGHKDEIIATTIVCYCISTLVTGIAFFLLGKFRLGQLIGFFPRHILIGSIGGVGYFLIITGLEVTSRLDSSFAYNWETLKFLFSGVTFLKWSSSIAITAILIFIQKFSKRLSSFSLLLPVYFMVIFGVIHLVILIVPSWNLQSARDNGFIFDVASSSSPSSPPSNQAWYHFYTLYKLKLVHWSHIISQVPTMMALTFFGMLHVPINVPALAISTNHDEVDLDRELIAHGYSNFISGCLGSIQNYLVYSNSLLFIRSGAGDKKLAGILLAICTAIVMFIGPALIKFIPVCVVGSLIFLLGYELMKESLYDSYSKLSTFDYTTIIVIIITMGLVDFVYGILLGILIAFISFVVENANQNPIKRIFTGEMARSTIKRNNLTNSFLRNVGSQTLVFKLQGNIFFGSIGKVEKEIKRYFEENTLRHEHGYRYLILDFSSVFSVDYTAAEGLQNIKNFTVKNNTFLILSSINAESTFKSLVNVGLINVYSSSEDSATQVFHDLNSALEWCENEYLLSIYNIKQQKKTAKMMRTNDQNYGSISHPSSSRVPTQIQNRVTTLDIPTSSNTRDDYKYNLTESYLNPMSLMNNPNGIGSPGQRNILRAITKSVDEESSFINHPDAAAAPQESTSHLNSSISKPISAASPSKTPTTSTPIDNHEQHMLELIKKTFQGYSSKPDTFWKPLITYLRPVTITKSQNYYPYSSVSKPSSPIDERFNTHLSEDEGSDMAGFFFIIESGLVQLSYDFYNQGEISETLVPRTAFGSLGIRPQYGSRSNASSSASTIRNGVASLSTHIGMVNRHNNFKVTALRDSKVWKLSYDNYKKMMLEPELKDVVNELLTIEVNLLSERFDKITNYILISS